MKDIIKKWFSIWLKVLSIIFGALGTVSFFLSLSDLIKETIFRVIIMCVCVLLTIVVSVLLCNASIHKKHNKVYSREKTNITFEYGDIVEVLNRADKMESITVVVPANTNLQIVFDPKEIYPNTIHHEALKYISDHSSKKLSEIDIKSIEHKKDGFSEDGKIGDWFIIKTDTNEPVKKIQFMFFEFYNVEKRDGKWKVLTPTEDEYLQCLQSLISTTSSYLDQESKVYIPLIGAGAGNIHKTADIMHFMKAILRFNKGILRQDIHIIINEDRKKDAPIYQLTRF